jgi:predicted aspartyl protease
VNIVANLPFMPAQVNTSKRLSVVLDSGAALSVVSPEVADQLDLQSSTSIEAAGMGKGASETLRLLHGATLIWGKKPDQLKLKDQTIASLPIDYIGAQTGQRADGIFGSNLFQNYRISIDYAANEVVFAPSGVPWHAPGPGIPIEVSGNVPVVEAELAAPDGSVVKAKFIVDIGTTGALILSKRFLDLHPELTAGLSWAAAPSVTAVGGTIDLKLVRLHSVRIGAFTLDGPIAAVPNEAKGLTADPKIAGTIGGDILHRFTATWDYGARKMWLVPNSRLHEVFRADASGMHLVAKGPNLRQIFIDSVLPGSAADRAGVHIGDRLEAVDGRRSTLWNAVERLMHAGSSVALSLVRNGERLRILFRLEKRI